MVFRAGVNHSFGAARVARAKVAPSLNPPRMAIPYSEEAVRSHVSCPGAESSLALGRAGLPPRIFLREGSSSPSLLFHLMNHAVGLPDESPILGANGPVVTTLAALHAPYAVQSLSPGSDRIDPPSACNPCCSCSLLDRYSSSVLYLLASSFTGMIL